MACISNTVLTFMAICQLVANISKWDAEIHVSVSVYVLTSLFNGPYLVTRKPFYYQNIASPCH